MSKLAKQISYKVIPGKENKAQDLCNKLHAIKLRMLKDDALGKPNYEAERAFVSMFIPELEIDKKINKNGSDSDKMISLKFMINDWIIANGKHCKEYTDAFDIKIKSNKPSFKNLDGTPYSVPMSNFSTSSIIGGSKPKTKKTIKTKTKKTIKTKAKKVVLLKQK